MPTCCCCCNLKLGVILIFVTDIIGFILHVVNIILIVQERNKYIGKNDAETSVSISYGYTRVSISYSIDSYTYDLMKTSFDFLIAVPVIMLVLYATRIGMFIAMRVLQKKYSFRRIVYRVRMSTTLVLIFLSLATIIGLGVIVNKNYYYKLYNINVTAIGCYVVIFFWSLAFDIYHSCVYMRYHGKTKGVKDGEEKGKKKP